MPNPSNYSDQNKWMDDCMHQMRKVEKKPQDQSVAVCLNRWREKDKKKKKCAAGFIRAIAEGMKARA